MPISRRFTWSAPRLAPITRAALWILLSGICSVMMNVLIRVAAQTMHPFEVAFFRCLFGLLLMTPWIITSGPVLWRSRNKGFYLLRAGVGVVSMATWFPGRAVDDPSSIVSHRSLGGGNLILSGSSGFHLGHGANVRRSARSSLKSKTTRDEIRCRTSSNCLRRQ